MWAAWHIKGAAGTLQEWRSMTGFDRSVVVHEIERRIALHNEPFED